MSETLRKLAEERDSLLAMARRGDAGPLGRVEQIEDEVFRMLLSDTPSDALAQVTAERDALRKRLGKAVEIARDAKEARKRRDDLYQAYQTCDDLEFNQIMTDCTIATALRSRKVNELIEFLASPAEPGGEKVEQPMTFEWKEEYGYAPIQPDNFEMTLGMKDASTVQPAADVQKAELRTAIFGNDLLGSPKGDLT